MRSTLTLVALVLLTWPLGAQAQATGSITGTVAGTDGRPLDGATVAVVESDVGTTTNADGRFTISGVAAGSWTLRTTYVGYSPGLDEVTISAGETASVSISLAPSVIELGEIVAVGYGTTRRRDLTGSVASVDGEDLTRGSAPMTAVSDALVGRAPGVQVVSNSGTPGQAATVRVRGTNSITGGSNPLYVVDGVPTSGGVDPNNIESIEILKDASSTAIYGARGANGVVLITTRRGSPGSNEFRLETRYGFQKPSSFIESLSAQEYRTLVNEALTNTGQAPRFTEEEVAEARTFDYPRFLLNDLQWQPQQSHNLTVSGGNEQTRYLVGLNMLDQEGIIVNSRYERIGGQLNLDTDVSDRFRLGVSLNGRRSVQALNGAASTGSGAGNTGITTAIQYDPAVFPYDSTTGEWNQRVTLNENFLNPYTEAVNRSGRDQALAAIVSLYGEYDILDRLTFRQQISGNFHVSRGSEYSPSFIGSGNNVGEAEQESAESRELMSSTTLRYSRDIGPGSLDVLVGADVQTSYYEWMSAEARGFPVDHFEFYNLGAGSVLLAPNSSTTEWTLLSQLGRINYNLLDRYLFTLTARRDGSSRFGENNKWAFFPSAAFAWRLVDEPFLENQRLFSDLKFRVSYGRTGNQAISPYQSLEQLTTHLFARGTGEDVVVLAPENSAGNADLRWETQDQYNVGVDLGVLNNRVLLTVDAYQSNTRDLLLNTNKLWISGVENQLRNVGSVRNRGIEAGLTTVNWQGDKGSWESSLNLSANRNEVTELYGGLQNLGTGSSTQVGEPLNTFVGYNVLGLYQQGDECTILNTVECTPGELKVQDTDGNGVINDDDRVNLGSPQPTFYGGFTNKLSYGPVSVDAYFNFSVGNEINAFGFNRYLGLVAGAANERRDKALRRWTPTNTNTDVPRANINRPGNRHYSTYVEDGSYLRLQSLSLSYDIPTHLFPGGHVAGARLTLTGQNLWITTRYTGFDPENANGAGHDSGGYPRTRSWNMGLNLTF